LGVLDRLRGLLELRQGDAAGALQSAQASIAATANGASRDARASLLLAAAASLALARPADAERFASQSLALAEAVARGPDSSADVGEALLLLAKAEIAQGRATQARPIVERATRCLTNGLGATHALSQEAITLSTSSTA
jgi:hypothetical protein